MSIYYISNLVEKEKFEKLYQNMPGQQVQKFNRLLFEGLKKNNIDIKCISVIPISRNLSNKKIIKLKNTDYFHYISTVNFPILKEFINLLKTRKVMKKIFKNDSDPQFIVDVLSPTNGYIVSKIANKKNVNCIGIVTDLPNFVSCNKLFNNLVNQTIDYCSKYVFLTDYMNKKINISNKQYCLIEGVCDYKIKNFNDKEREKVVIYAGSLSKVNGISNLVEAFKEFKDYTLEIYGVGDYVNNLINISKKYKNIKYLGHISNDKIIKRLPEVKLLVNPRPTNEEFTKYSFPSKTMEYMASGTPLISTKLIGIPEEYFEYIYAFDNYDVEGIKQGLKRVLNYNEKDLIIKAKNAQDFVLKYKNNRLMVKKIIKLLD